jgi:hypothetical protein
MKTAVLGPSVECGAIVTLAGQESSSNPSITSALTTNAQSVAQTPAAITKAVKMVTQDNDDYCAITVAFPGTSPQEKLGMFGGMKWKDFITTHSEDAKGWIV